LRQASCAPLEVSQTLSVPPCKPSALRRNALEFEIVTQFILSICPFRILTAVYYRDVSSCWKCLISPVLVEKKSDCVSELIVIELISSSFNCI
jgi:hypothetical protein